MLDPCDAKIYYIKWKLVTRSMTYISWSNDFVISGRLVDGLMLYWRNWFNVTETLIWNYICRSMTYISWSSDLPYILQTIWWTNVIIGLLDSCDAKINHMKCMLVSDLHFMVQWFWHILKTFWWRNVGLKILIQCGIKFDLQLYM